MKRFRLHSLLLTAVFLLSNTLLDAQVLVMPGDHPDLSIVQMETNTGSALQPQTGYLLFSKVAVPLIIQINLKNFDTL